MAVADPDGASGDGTSGRSDPPGPDDYAPTAVPSVWARAGAFAAILVGGLCGGLIGYAVVDLQCDGDCSVLSALGGVVGAVAIAVGVGVVAVLALRASAEWRAVEQRRR